MSSEFTLIEQYFGGTGKKQISTKLSQGDDAAVIEVPSGYQLVMSIDTLIAGVHFPEQTSPSDIAYKALAVNLSDLAAMAATPAWFLLSISLPNTDESWLSSFSQSLQQMAEQYSLELIGGDTCQGPLSITIQINGLVQDNEYITRSSAKTGDLIVVSGQLGNAALGLADCQGKIKLPKSLESRCISALNRPVPRLDLTIFLQRHATAAIDISDGLVGDLRHILDESKVGATIRKDDLPVADWIRENNAFQYALYGGDDYELCFTMPKKNEESIHAWNAQNSGGSLTIIGEITESGYYLSDDEEITCLSQAKGFQHFGE